MEEPTSARVNLTRRDFQDASYIHRRCHPSWLLRSLRNWAFPALLVVTVMMVGAMMIESPIRPGQVNRSQLWVSLMPLVLPGWLLVLISPAFRRLEASSLFKRFTPAQLEQNWVIDDQGLSITSPPANSELRWDFYRRVTEGREAFLLYVTANQFQLIPTRAFPSAEAMDRFAAIARRQVPNYVVYQHCRYPPKPEPIGLGDF